MSKKVKLALFAVVIILVAGSLILGLSDDGSAENTKIINGYYDCYENGFAVPGDALYYCEYYYDTDVSKHISKTYSLVTENNYHEVEFYLNNFKERFLTDSDKEKKDFLDTLNQGDYYYLESGCSSEINENHFLLYYYDCESKTVYYMFRCQ